LAAPDVAHRLRAQQLSEGMGALASIAAAAALGDAGHVRSSARLNADARQEFVNQANARMNRAIDSHANFVMLDADRPATRVVEHFRASDVLIGRPFPGFPKHVRVSMGSADDMRAFWRVRDLMPRRTTM
jgi:histidinol-phosphate aminotransferase